MSLKLTGSRTPEHGRNSLFVGRAKERALLSDALASASAGRAQVALIAGEAGVGKTRLAEYTASALCGDRVRVLVGSCISPGSNSLPLAPVVGALRRLALELGIENSAALFPEGFGFERLLLELGAAQPEGKAAGNGLFLQGFISFLKRLSVDQPLLLILEDIQEADPETYKLLNVLARELDAARLLIVATYRTDDLGRSHPLRSILVELRRINNVRLLKLNRFSHAETAELIENITGERPSSMFLEKIFSRSNGNALFVEQLVHAERSGMTDGIPDSLCDLLLNRVEQLPRLARETVQLIAVGGPWISHRLLAAVADMAEGDLLDALRSAVDAHVLITSEDGYDFQHSLLREAVLSELLPGEKIRIHQTYADALDEQPDLVMAEYHAASTAHHWLAARRPEKALPALMQAAAVAEEFRAYGEQHQLLVRALTAWPNVVSPVCSRLELLVSAAHAAWRAVENDHAHLLIDQALDEADSVADADRVAALLALRSRILLRLGDEGALAAAQEADRLTPPQPSPTRVMVLEVLGAALTSEGQAERGCAVSREAVDLAVDLGDAELEVNARITAGLALGHCGRHEQAVAE